MLRILHLCILTKLSFALTTIDPDKLLVERTELFTPSLDEVVYVLNKGLKENYADVQADVVECPDLTQIPFNLSSVGLNGYPRIVDVGSPSYVGLSKNYTKVYDFVYLPMLIDLDKGFIIGASAGSYKVFGDNSECAIDISVSKEKVVQQTRVAKYKKNENSHFQDAVPTSETRFTFLGNFYVSTGDPGLVLKIVAKKRIGNDDFATSIRKSLINHFGNRLMGLGGTFLIKKGLVKQHVIPDIPDHPFTSEEEIINWFKYFNMSAPLVAVGAIVTGDHVPELDLRDQHFHSFSSHGDGGHYHIDTTPDITEYEGYFNVAEFVYRIDKPRGSS